MASERSEYFGCGVAIVIAGLLLLWFTFSLRGCIQAEEREKNRIQQNRENFEKQQKHPSDYQNPDYYPRSKWPPSKVTKISDNEWELFLTPCSGNSDDGWKWIDVGIGYGCFLDIQPINTDSKVKFFVRTNRGMQRFETRFYESRGQIYEWSDCEPGMRCFEGNPVIGLALKMSEDSPILTEHLRISRKALPNYN